MPSFSERHPGLYWTLIGARGIFSLPALILMTSFVGFSAFALESGITREAAMFMTFAVWALPAKMILTGMVASGANILAIFIAVSLSSIRMMPMVASLVPEIRNERTPSWVLLILAHFVAITAWVFTMRHVGSVPRAYRTRYFAGFGLTLTLSNTILVGICYGLVATFPPVVAGALFFLTPVYFVASIWLSSRQAVLRLAFIVGTIGGPLLALWLPGFDILIAGIGGGTLAYGIDRFVLRSQRHTEVPAGAGAVTKSGETTLKEAGQ